MRKIVLAGGSGYIGSVLADFLSNEFDEVVIFSRSSGKLKNKIRVVVWDAKNSGEWVKELEDAEALINLTGKNVNCRYNTKNKKEILDSRLDATNALGLAISKLKNPPRTWIQIASATIYRHAEDHAMDEIAGEIGEGFSVAVCKKWEETFWKQNLSVTRKVLLRTSIVLGNRGGVFPRLLNLVRFGIGGHQGNGKQMISWIHDEDLVRLIGWVISNPEIKGIFNATSPQPVSNQMLMKSLRKTHNIPFGLSSPIWILKFGAWLIGTETELILKSRWVIPKKLEQLNFSFKFSEINVALADIMSKK
jgi:uncharacterized protein (TIGR01777 family)